MNTELFYFISKAPLSASKVNLLAWYHPPRPIDILPAMDEIFMIEPECRLRM
ncbi:hypothetical protein SAMN05216327_12337 [Dyadobacter sp. SG02]|nr:hypothetical protein [Dyadobacter sp. SG02]SEJ83860.1 hypothetical protein SAMN05216327_12337 [Dyadobacter sp. SG02]